MRNITFILFVLLTSFIYGQNCNCSDSYAWLKETFEKNDAGFQYAVDQKGEAAYKKQCELTLEKIKSITDKKLCYEALEEWLRFFRRGHLWLAMLGPDEKQGATPAESKEKIRQQYKNWESYPYNEKEFNTYLSRLKEPGLEGIWVSPPYKIGIRKVNNEYIGFIIEADGVYWSRSQVKFKIKDTSGKLGATYYMQNHSAKEISEVNLLGKNYLLMEFVMLKRIVPEFPPDKELDRSFKFQETNVPLFEKLSEKTCIIRIPSFDGSKKKMIDSVIKVNYKTITSTENFIIDVRNNGGGSDMSFSELIPFIYTDPVRTVGLEYLSTSLNNKRMESFLKEPDLSEEDKKWINSSLEKLNNNLGKFVNLDSSIVSTFTYDSIYTYPKQVGIIINGGCGSTTEQFILTAKQSRKVKLFGTTTFGSLDVSNMYSVKSPCNDLELGYCLSKSFRIPQFTIDGKGLQPDYFLDTSIPNYEWLNFTMKTLEGKK